MTAADIVAAYISCGFISDAVLLGLIGRGVDLAALLAYWRDRPDLIPRLARVDYVGPRNFEFADEPGTGEGAVVWLVTYGDTAIDLAAWIPGRRTIATWLSSASMIGDPFAFRAGACRVDSDPIAWMRGCCDGVLVIDSAKAAATLMEVDEIEVASRASAQALRSKFETRLPRIGVAAPDHRSAPPPPSRARARTMPVELKEAA